MVGVFQFPKEGRLASGTGRRSRLQWLRERLELGTTAAAGLASAAVVAQTCVQLLD